MKVPIMIDTRYEYDCIIYLYNERHQWTLVPMWQANKYKHYYKVVCHFSVYINMILFTQWRILSAFVVTQTQFMATGDTFLIKSCIDKMQTRGRYLERT